MATLSKGQIMAYAQSAGLSASAARTAAAIAMAESGGNTQAHNAVPPDDSYGLWQINMLGSMGPARRRQYGITSNSQLFDPAVNARAMAAISSHGSNWSPWSTYTNGAYRKYLDGGLAADSSGVIQAGAPGDPLGDFWDWLLGPPKRGPGSPDWDGNGPLPGDGGGGTGVLGDDPLGLGGALKGLNSLATLGVGAANWLGNAHNWIRVAQVIGGGALVLLGANLAVRGIAFKAAAPLVDTATDVVPGGGVAKKVAAKGAAKSAAKGAAKKAAAPAAEGSTG